MRRFSTLIRLNLFKTVIPQISKVEFLSRENLKQGRLIKELEDKVLRCEKEAVAIKNLESTSSEIQAMRSRLEDMDRVTKNGDMTLDRVFHGFRFKNKYQFYISSQLLKVERFFAH